MPDLVFSSRYFVIFALIYTAPTHILAVQCSAPVFHTKEKVLLQCMSPEYHVRIYDLLFALFFSAVTFYHYTAVKIVNFKLQPDKWDLCNLVVSIFVAAVGLFLIC